MYKFLERSRFASLEDVDQWVRDGFLEWKNNTIRANYDDDDEIDVVNAFKTDKLVTTDEGFTTSWHNIVFGVSLLLGFHLSELNDVFYDNKYRLGKIEGNGVCRVMAAWLVLLMQVVVASCVILAAARSVLTNSLETVSTIEAALNAYFILEIDDKILPVFWTCIKEKGVMQLVLCLTTGACICDFVLRYTCCNRLLHAYQHSVKKDPVDDEFEIELNEVKIWPSEEDTKRKKSHQELLKNLLLPVLAIFAIAIVLMLRGFGIMVLDAIQILDKSWLPVCMLQSDA